MTLFLASFAVMALAALALSLGALRGRPLPGGACSEGRLAAHLLPRCEACPARRAGPDAAG